MSGGETIIPVVAAVLSKYVSTDVSQSFWTGNQGIDISVYCCILGIIFAFMIVFAWYLDRR